MLDNNHLKQTYAIVPSRPIFVRNRYRIATVDDFVRETTQRARCRTASRAADVTDIARRVCEDTAMPEQS